MHFVMSQMAGFILAQSKALLFGLFRFAGQKHKSLLENFREEWKLGLKIQDNKRFFVHPDIHWLPLKAQIYFASLFLRALKLEQ